MEFRRLAESFERIENTSKRLELTALVLQLLKDVPTRHVDKAVYMVQGKLYPDFVGVELGVAEKLTIRAVARTYGVDEADVLALVKKTGDLGLATEQVAGKRKQKPMSSEPLTLEGVYATFERIAKAQGAGSQDQKVGGLAQVLSLASSLEARYLVRLATGKLRLGVADQTFIEALSILLTHKKVVSVTELEKEERAAWEEAKAIVQKAADVTSDLGLVAKTALEGGLAALKKLKLRMGVPLRPMLAERAETLEEALGRMPGRAFVEYKYDGLRMQAHVGKEVQIFSRRLERLTEQFPDVVAALRKAFGTKQVIVEGEVVAIDPKTGRIKPFQEVATRRGRKLDEAQARGIGAEIPVRLFLFDLLWYEGEDHTERPLSERRKLLEKITKPNDAIELGELTEMKDVKEIEEYFQAVTLKGAEGIMIKNPDSTYQAGARGYSWIKFKADYNAALADTFDLVAVGAYWGQGRRGGWYGALLMASYNDGTGRFETLCRLATGFDDVTLEGLEKRFKPFVVASKAKNVETVHEADVWFEPAVVLEVQGAELTLSPHHRCAWGVLKPDAGLSVRFPRFTGRWRDDKKATQATTTQEVVKMFEARRKKMGS
jgi:DNA ligase-1